MALWIDKSWIISYASETVYPADAISSIENVLQSALEKGEG